MLNLSTANTQKRLPSSPSINYLWFPLPNSGYGEVVQLDVLNDFIQQPIRHGIKICKCVHLEGE